jgi:hypothetical protein
MMKREPNSLKRRGKRNSNATVKEDNFQHRSGEMQALSRAEENHVPMLQT